MIFGSGGINWGHYADIDLIQVGSKIVAHVNREWRVHYGEAGHPETVGSYKFNEAGDCPDHDEWERLQQKLPRYDETCAKCQASAKRLTHSVTLSGSGVGDSMYIEVPLEAVVPIFSFHD